MENPESTPPEETAPQNGPPGAWEQPGPEPAAPPGAAPAAPPKSKKRRRACCLGCLGLALLPFLVLLALLIWLGTGPAPAPADCLPADYPVRITVRDPVGIVEDYAEGERWRRLLLDIQQASGDEGKLPSRKEAGDIAFWLRRLLGSEVALAINRENRWFIAARCGFLGRGFGKLGCPFAKTDPDGLRYFKKGKGEDKPYFAYIGNTVLISDDRQALLSVLARRKQILAGKASAAPPAETRAELGFKDFKLTAEQAAGPDARFITFLFDLPGLEGLSGHLRADRALEKLSGELTFVAGRVRAPPALPAGGPISAKLVPAGALGYWAWHAPAGAGRWSPQGRLKAFEAAERAGKQDPAEPGMAEDDLARRFGKELVGERAVFITSQPIPSEQSLQVAATVLMEVRDVKTAWPLYVQLVGAWTGFQLSADGRPPTHDGTEIYPHLVKRLYKGREYVEMIYAYYPQGSGYRPAFGSVGRFLVATSSRMELERMLDQAAADLPAGRTLADEPGMLPARGAPRPAALLLFRPGGRGKDLSDLALLISRINSPPDKQPGEAATRRAAALGRLLDRVKSVRVTWLPQADGSLKLTVQGELLPQGR